MHFKNLWARAITLAIYSDLHATRFLIGLAEIACATLLLVVGGALDYPSYTIMREVMPDKAWTLPSSKLLISQGATATKGVANSWTGYLTAGDVLRAHTGALGSFAAFPNLHKFHIVKLPG